MHGYTHRLGDLRDENRCGVSDSANLAGLSPGDLTTPADVVGRHNQLARESHRNATLAALLAGGIKIEGLSSCERDRP